MHLVQMAEEGDKQVFEVANACYDFGVQPSALRGESSLIRD